MTVRLSDHFTYPRLLRFVAPSVAMMMVTSVYSIVDGFFISNIVGKNAFAAVNLIMRLLAALGAFGFMIGTGGAALVSLTLGQGETDRANRYFSMLTQALAGIGLLLALIGFLWMPDFARLLGAGPAILNDCALYGRVLILAIPFFMLQNSFQSFLVSAEKPQMGLQISLAAGLCNVLLDFLLVYVFRQGILGAALATALSQALGALIPLAYFARPNGSLLRLSWVKIAWRALSRACANGSSEMMTNLSSSLVGMLYNFQLLRLAAEDGLAAYGVIMYVNFVFMACFFGYSIGASPVISYHYGAGNSQELKNLFRKSMVVTALASAAMLTSAITLAQPLSRLFVGYDSDLLAMTAQGMALYSTSFLICGFNVFASSFFTALNNGLLSALISFLRTLIFQVAAILILPRLWGLNGVWLALTAAELAAVAVSAFLLWKKRGQYHYC